MDVDPAAGHVRGHQDVLGPSLQVGEGELSLLLPFAAVQGAGVVLQDEKGVSGGWKWGLGGAEGSWGVSTLPWLCHSVEDDRGTPGTRLGQIPVMIWPQDKSLGAVGPGDSTTKCKSFWLRDGERETGCGMTTSAKG